MRFAAAVVMLLVACPAWAQTDESVGTSDTVFVAPSTRVPISYITSYDRDVSTGTWTQSLNYSLNKPRVALSTSGSYSIVDQLGRASQGSGGGSFAGRMDIRAAKNWIVTADGRYNKNSTRDIISNSTQRQNRLKVSSQYSVAPWKSVGIRAILASEFQEDHSLALRPPGQGIARILVLTNALGDSVGVDTFYVTRDSTLTTGRQDGLSGQVDWKPKPWFTMVTSAQGNRLKPATTSHLGGNELNSTTFEQRLDQTKGGEPNDNLLYQTKMTYTGPRGLGTWVSLKRTRTDQSYYDRTALRQDLFSVDQRSGTMHLEQPIRQRFVLNLDGTLSRFLGQYKFRNNRNSLLNTKSGKAAMMYFSPRGTSRGSVEFDVDSNRNSRQQTGNGTNVTRFLQATGAHRLSSKLSLDAVGTASLTTFQYVDSVLDQDNQRVYANGGGGYRVSDRCSTLVHFSVSRGHSVALDPSRSANNNVQTTYQMDSSMKLGVTPRITVSQLYLLNAVYQIYDFTSAESKNSLSRIRRIDTYVSDSLFSFATLQLNHNFLFRDFGTFSKPPGGTDRLYHVFSHTYVQTVSATINVRPAYGMLLFATQSLSNTRVTSTGPATINNRWNLSLGATIQRTIMGNGDLNGTVQHIEAYDARMLPTDPRNAQSDWIAGVTLVKYF